MRKLCALSIVALAVGSGVATSTAQAHFLVHKKHLTLHEKIVYFNKSVEHDRDAIAWLAKTRARLQKNVRVLTTRYDFARGVYHELVHHRAALRWHLALQAHYQAKWDKLHPPPPPHLYAWLCIHRYEGSWQDDGSPYYGGLQMDIGFQQHYGGALLRTKGTANNWTPLEQMWVAEKAYSSGRGFYPWPNTARTCGLI